MTLYGSFYRHSAEFRRIYVNRGSHKYQDKLKAGQTKFLGVTLPSWLLHAPIFNVGQLGATIRNVHDKYESKDEKGALSNGVWARRVRAC